MWKIMMKINNHHILNIGMWIVYMGGQMLQELPVNKFEWIKNNS